MDGGRAHRVSHLAEKLLAIDDCCGKESQFSGDVVPNRLLMDPVGSLIPMKMLTVLSELSGLKKEHKTFKGKMVLVGGNEKIVEKEDGRE